MLLQSYTRTCPSAQLSSPVSPAEARATLSLRAQAKLAGME